MAGNNAGQLRGNLNVRDLSVSNLDRDLEVLRQIRRAFVQRVDFIYRTCVRCEAQIIPARIGISPWTAFCDRCEEFVHKQSEG